MKIEEYMNLPVLYFGKERLACGNNELCLWQSLVSFEFNMMILGKAKIGHKKHETQNMT